jgi:phosphoribosylformimino-5-aminoimidazole carboxamide ribotide isomerase
MIVFPAIDLIAGKVVRLERGDRARMKVYSDDPVAVAETFRAAGARWIHVVDLSATLEEDAAAQTANAAAIEGICAVEGIQVDAGGGVRSMAAFERLLDLGVKRVAVGTALVRDPGFARAVAAEHAANAVADVAARDGQVRVNGWREAEALLADELIARLADLGFRHLVFTDVARDGMQTGIDTAAYAHIAEVAGFPVVASGGIASVADIEALAALGPAVIEGAICGRAIFEGSLALEDSLAAAKGE